MYNNYNIVHAVSGFVSFSVCRYLINVHLMGNMHYTGCKYAYVYGNISDENIY